ncbi:ParA family protein [Limosilactobacillus reuteri]|uniref:ParA family protein n=1 Tax=Limosilactobacillus reuteri TaxID=1598 RepID=UPI001159C2BE|nr:AAA family ATPase [Limosilactobacillus reuteri]MCC4388275.1 AAA family ATPase [Limosilactobacillus reuteri]MCC4394353.1 AAA family ATPase [Limosilactobacillus reuteri]QDK49487.1 ParA family protein [Limosilactobacillus reuteri]QKT16266.1 AAA family ATPase [Limosilactobacillus reuteri]
MPVLVYANFKGGVGKTTNSVMTAYQLAKKGYKVLVCDLDPQSNATHLLTRTYSRQNNQSKQEFVKEIVKQSRKEKKQLSEEEIDEEISNVYEKREKKELKIEKTMMLALSEEDVESAIVKVMDNLYLLPSDADFTDYPDFLEQTFMPNEDNYKEKRTSYFSKQLSKVKDNYDFVIVDVPPTLSIYTDSAVYAADDIIIVLQTQQDSLDGAIAFFKYLQKIFDKYHAINFDILGILPVLLENRAGLDSQILKDAKATFGKENVFKNIIKHMERLKRFGRVGIADKDAEYGKGDFHDIKVHYVYNKLTDEILDRLKKLED